MASAHHQPVLRGSIIKCDMQKKENKKLHCTDKSVSRQQGRHLSIFAPLTMPKSASLLPNTGHRPKDDSRLWGSELALCSLPWDPVKAIFQEGL